MEFTAYDRLILSRRPVLYWPLADAAGNPMDLTENGRGVTTLSGPTRRSVPGPFPGDRGIQFVSGEGALRSSVMTQTDNFTFEVWVRPLSVGAANQGIIKNSGSGPSGYDLFLQTGFQVQGIAQNIAFLNQSTTALFVSQWNHVVWLRDGGNWRYWINGKRDATDGGNTAPSAPASGTTGFDSLANLSREVARYAIYDRALIPTEIFDNYRAGLDGPPSHFLRQLDTPAFIGGYFTLDALGV